MEGGQPIGGQGDGVGLAGACAVLDEIVPACTVGCHIRDQLAHHVQLVIAGEDDPLSGEGLLRSVGQQQLLLRHLQMDKLLQNVHHAVLLEHLLPQVRRGVALGIRRVPLAAVVAALVEGHKEGVLAPKLRGHPHIRMVYGEVAQDTLVEPDAEFPGVPVVHPLPHRVVCGLAGVLVFQLQGEHGDAVDRQHHVHALVDRGGIEPLSVAGDLVGSVQGSGRGMQLRFWLEIADLEGDAPVFEPVVQHMDQPVHLAGVVKGQAELPRGVHLVPVDEPQPLPGLGPLHEPDQRVREQPQFSVVHIPTPRISPSDEYQNAVISSSNLFSVVSVILIIKLLLLSFGSLHKFL